jgi:hypothetical protein
MQQLCIVAYRDRGLERQKTSKLQGDYANMIWEQHGVSKLIEIKYFKFDC